MESMPTGLARFPCFCGQPLGLAVEPLVLMSLSPLFSLSFCPFFLEHTTWH